MMNTKAVIAHKRDGGVLDADEIAFMVTGAAEGSIPDYQLSAFLMAVYLRGMNDTETADLTRAMTDSGDRLVFAGRWPAADKHSTGGVGDKISFLVAPLVAACGVSVPMISGRSLGHTGGTLDKLESVPGLRTNLSSAEFARQVDEIGLAIAEQNDRLAPADKKLYALRDAAAIVESVPLITGSILSKKAAAGVSALALDVKVGRGAFMSSSEQGEHLARSLVRVAAMLGLKARAHLTPMDLVLGRTAGNALEIMEAVDFLRGNSPAPDLEALTLLLGASMLELSGAARTREDADRELRAAWTSGAGLERLLRLIERQGGDPSAVESGNGLPKSNCQVPMLANRDGWFEGVDARSVGEWITRSGGGRLRVADRIEPSIGLEILRESGERIRSGDEVARLHLGAAGVAAETPAGINGWIRIGDSPPRPFVPEISVYDTADPHSSSGSS